MSCGGREMAPRTSFKCRLYFSCPFGSIQWIHLSHFENRILLVDARGVASVTYFITVHEQRDSIKPSLQFSVRCCAP